MIVHDDEHGNVDSVRHLIVELACTSNANVDHKTMAALAECPDTHTLYNWREYVDLGPGDRLNYVWLDTEVVTKPDYDKLQAKINAMHTSFLAQTDHFYRGIRT